MRIRALKILMMLATLGLGLMLAPARALFAQALLFEQYTIKDGLPSNWVTTIYQDSHGYLWIGGDGGLAVYDGVQFKRYGSKEGLPVPHVWSIIESQESPDTYYIGTHGGGLTIFRNGQFSSRQVGDSFASNVVGHLLEDNTGRLWCGTNAGLFTFDGDNLVPFRLPGMQPQWVGFIKQTSDGHIWISHARQLYRYSPQDSILLDLNATFPDSVWYLCLREDDDGTLWIGTDSGMIHKVKGDRIIASKKLAIGHPREILDDRQGNLWITTLNGPALLNKSSFPHGDPAQFTNINGTLHEDVSPGFIDREDNLWFGTPQSGVYKLSDRNVVVFPFENINAAGWNSILVDENDHLLIAARDGLWEVWFTEDGSWKHQFHDKAALQLEAEVNGLATSADGTLWLAVGEVGIGGYHRAMHRQIATAFRRTAFLHAGVELHTGGRFGGFMIDRNNQLWYSRTAGNGVSQFDLNSWQRVQIYTTAQGIPFGTISATLLDQAGKMWFGEFNGGVAVFRPDGNRYVHERTYTKEDGLAGNQIRSMIQRRNGEIWMGHRYDGISIFRDGRFAKLSTADGLINDAVWALAEDHQGRVWLATSAGIQHTEPGLDRTFITDKRLIRHTSRVLGEIPGQNIMYMMNFEDLTLYSPPEKRQPQEAAVPVKISALRVSGKATDLGATLSFQSAQNPFEFEYVGISLKDGDLLRFHYELSNGKAAWQGTTNQRTVQFASLRPGNYRFRVTAITTDGIESPAPSELNFTVLPPIWQRWWFIALAVITLGAFLYGLHQLRLQQVLAVEKIRLRISSDLHDDIGAGLTHIGLLSEVTLRKASGQPAAKDAGHERTAIQELHECVVRVGHIARELSASMSDAVWSINPKHDSIDALYHRLSAFAHDVCEARGIKLNLQISDRIGHLKLNPDSRRNLLLIAKEALHNVAKYSGSSDVDVHLRIDGKHLLLQVVDYGNGFDPAGDHQGNGMASMRSRAEKIGGRFELASEPGNGTRVTAVIPYK